MIGKRIGHYEIVEKIPGGGMAEVYRAVQLTLDRTVAIKVPRPELAESAQDIARFRREAQTLARLDHENIVRIFDIEEHDGLYFIIMEYVGGGSLEGLLRRSGRLEPRRACEIAASVADALAAAHRERIIHRDLKPGNILFTPAGRPKLADFGIARILDLALTAQSQVLGTPHYMSPEQVRGGAITPASDIYSLGVVLYEMLTGQVPFNADTPFGVALMHVQEEPPPLSSRAPGLPPSLSSLVHRALAKDPAQRFASAEAFRQQLLALDLESMPLEVAPSSITVAASGEPGFPCAECGTLLQPGFLTCPRCGLPVSEPPRPAAVLATAAPTATATPQERGPGGPGMGVGGAPAAGPSPLIAGADAARRHLQVLARIPAALLDYSRGRPVVAGGAAAAILALVALGIGLQFGGRGEPQLSADVEPEISETVSYPFTSIPALPSLPAGSGGPPASGSPDPQVASGGPGGEGLQPMPIPPADLPSQSSPPQSPPGSGPAAERRAATPAAPATSTTPQPQAESRTASRSPEAQLRTAVNDLINRHQRAVRNQDLGALLADVEAGLQSRWRSHYSSLFSEFTELTSKVEILDLYLDPRDPDRARATVLVRMEGVDDSGDRSVLAYERREWDLQRVGGRWLIFNG